MIDLEKFNLSEEDIEFINNLRDIEKSQVNVSLRFNDNFHFDFDVYGGQIHVFSNDNEIGTFKTLDDFLLNFVLEGKPFIEQISKVDFN